jgi:hypothetical protein
MTGCLLLRADSVSLRPALLLAICFCVLAPRWATAQQSAFTVEGYITAVSSPNAFDVNGMHVITSSGTLYGIIGDTTPRHDSPLNDAVQIGAFVRVSGSTDKQSKTSTGSVVDFRDDSDKKLTGFGVIEKVIEAGPEPLFETDGYRLRITSNTEVHLSKGLNTLTDVDTNTWVKYEGKRNQAGELVAARAEFVLSRQGKIKPAPKQDVAPSQDSLINANGSFESMRAKVRFSDSGGVCGWHRFPADKALQERVRRVGMSMIPAYQKQLADDSPSKIHFRFYAVDEAKIRSAFSCNEGLILVPRQVVERLKSDDELAAVMADGVAHSIQLQSARLIAEWRELFGAELAGAVAEIFVPEVYFANEIGGDIVAHKIEMRMQEQAGRISLALMTDAGYDPWQAPEAWRLLAPKKLPGDVSMLKYPNRSGYQLGILNVQYRTTAGGGTR